MKKLLLDLVWWQLHALGALPRSRCAPAAARESGHVLPVYDAWFRETLRLFSLEGYLDLSDGRVSTHGGPEAGAELLWKQWEEQKSRWRQNEDLADSHILLETTMRALPEILTGVRSATEVMFPDSSLSLVENTYKNNALSEFFNTVLATQLVDHLQKCALRAPRTRWRIFEIGAGTGATSALALRALRDANLPIAEYCYTDISKAFLNHAEQAYGTDYPFLHYQVFNTERPAAAQGIEERSYDVVIAANVLHATRSIMRTLSNAKSLLERGGVLLLNEMTSNNLYNHLTFGLLEGWWLYEDPHLRLPGSPGLSVEGWRSALERAGFRAVSFPCPEASDLGGQIIVAESDGELQQPELEAAADLPSVSSAQASNQKRASRAAAAPAASTGAVMKERVQSAVLDELSKTLRVDASRLRTGEPFSSYGLDSILAVQLTRELNQKLELDLDITVAFEHATVDALTAHILSAMPAAGHTSAVVDGAASGHAAEPPSQPLEAAERAPEARRHQAFDASSSTAPVRSATADAVSAGKRASRPAASDAAGFAIIGVSARLPQAEELSELWEILESGRSCITAPPYHRDDWKPHAEGAQGKGSQKWGGFLQNIHEFDPLFFGISMTEARQMSPEQRLMLLCAWNAVEDAGYTPGVLGRESTGVFMAVGPSEYQAAEEPAASLDETSVLSPPLASMVPNRVSYFLNLHGPSEYCETTCSSGLVALHRAVQSLSLGECEQAIVGAVQLIMSPAGFSSMESVGMLSPTGAVRPFQDDAEGTVRSEGVGAIVVKPLARAISDGDHIYAVVRGTGVAHGGKGVSFTAPNIRGMKQAIAQAHRVASLLPEEAGYIEAHAMSSSIADGAELSALKAVFGHGASARGRRDDPADDTIFVGTLKPCFGHTEVFSGMAALIKTVLALEHRTIVGIPGFAQLSSKLSLQNSRLAMAVGNKPWPQRRSADGRVLPRRANINSFGIGGVNAHAILEQAPAVEDGAGEVPEPQVLVLSAQDEERLRLRIERLVARLKRGPVPDLADVAYTLQVGREAMDHRAAIVACDTSESIERLEQLLARPDHERGGPLSVSGSRNQELVELFSTSAGDGLVRALVSEGKLEKLASYWTQGAAVDWQILHQGRRRRRVPLPGYPFRQVNCSLAMAGPRVPPARPRTSSGARTDIALSPEEFITSLVGSVLGLDPSQIDKARPLHLYGLNSLLLVTMLNHIRSAFPGFQPSWLQADISLNELSARMATVAGGILHAGSSVRRQQAPELIHLNDKTQGHPVFWVHGALGSVEAFQAVAQHSRRPFYAIQARGYMTGQAPIEGIAAMAAHYLDLVRSVQPEGGYDLGGFCLGGIISYEMTRQLQTASQHVRSLVMVDSPDNTGFTRTIARANFSSHNAALQVANTLLWPAKEQDLDRVVQRLIHQDEIDSSLDSDQFVERLAALAVERGLPMSREAVAEFIRRNLRVQLSYKLGEYTIEPLPQAPDVACTYFRNRRGLFFGELGSYFKIAGEPFSLDQVNYWQDWERELTNLRMVDVDASNHMTILYEDAPLRIISGVCEHLYGSDEVSAQSIAESDSL